jgi:hypothetical protein
MPKAEEKKSAASVFNICVDKHVEKRASSTANYTILSIVERFAQFLCKLAAFRRPLRNNFPPRGKDFRTTFCKCLIFNTNGEASPGES